MAPSPVVDDDVRIRNVHPEVAEVDNEIPFDSLKLLTEIRAAQAGIRRDGEVRLLFPVDAINLIDHDLSHEPLEVVPLPRAP